MSSDKSIQTYKKLCDLITTKCTEFQNLQSYLKSLQDELTTLFEVKDSMNRTQQIDAEEKAKKMYMDYNSLSCEDCDMEAFLQYADGYQQGMADFAEVHKIKYKWLEEDTD